MPRCLVWQMPASGKQVYLTFDDGPVPGVTEEALAILNRFQARATFFCVGDNVRKYPETFRRIKEEGHSVGNHTFHHLNGWKSKLKDYIEDVRLCDELLHSRLFRPPHGRITRKQALVLSKNYKIIMWSLLSGDFDPSLTADQCVNNVIRFTRPGSIIVMHDGEKAAKRMLQALPRVLEYFSEKGFEFRQITI